MTILTAAFREGSGSGHVAVIYAERTRVRGTQAVQAFAACVWARQSRLCGHANECRKARPRRTFHVYLYFIGSK